MKKRAKWNQRFLTLFIMLFLCTANLLAQSMISGTVNDSKGESLPGTSVYVKGSNNGTVTDADGKYVIQAKQNDILVFSFLGMSTQEIKVSSKQVINVVMKDDIAALDEVLFLQCLVKIY